MASKQLKHMAELDASIQERDIETQVKKRVQSSGSRRLHRAEMRYESQIETQRRDPYQ
jgi:hypothetical protein